MPFCEVCKYEYVDDITICPDCGVKLVDKLPDEKNELEGVIDEELVTIFTTNDTIEATLVKEMLESSGITVLEQPGMTYYGKLIDSLADLSLAVFKSDVEKAVKLIKEAQ